MLQREQPLPSYVFQTVAPFFPATNICMVQAPMYGVIQLVYSCTIDG